MSRKRINWFSPLPPGRTEIAQYSARILPALARLSDVTLWTDQPKWDPAPQHGARVRRYDPRRVPWRELNAADLNVYHLGNNHLFHAGIWQVSRRYPGLVVLHDLRLHDLFAGVYRGLWKDRVAYLLEMERHYGERGRREGEEFWDGRRSAEQMASTYSLMPLAVENALAIMVHTRQGVEEAAGLKNYPVVRAPLPHLATRTRGRDRLVGPPYKLVTFGFISPNRRLNVILEALASMPERNLFRLDIYGELWDNDYVTSRAIALGFELGRDVTLHGFVPEEELCRALDGAHLALNLRYPTMGEASASQLRIWDHALPSLVTRVGWYAELPEDSVAFVRPEHELHDVCLHLRALLKDPDKFARLGENGRRVLHEHHSPDSYAQTIAQCADRAAAWRCRRIALDRAWRIGEEMGFWADPAALPESFERPAHELLRLLLPRHRWPPGPTFSVAPGPMARSGFLARILPRRAPEVLVAGSRCVLGLTVSNLGKVPWPALGSAHGAFQVSLGSRWLGGVQGGAEDGRCPLPHDVPPMGKVRLALAVHAPAEPGEYVLEIDMTQEGVAWFGDCGSLTSRHSVVVIPARDPAHESGAVRLGSEERSRGR